MYYTFQCVTPHNAIEKAEEIIRDVKETPSSEIVEFGKIELQDYSKNKGEGLVKLVVLEVNASNENCSKIVPTSGDFLWLFEKWSVISKDTPGWNGFMEAATKHMDFEKSKILYFSFIENPPSDYETILTSLLYAVEKTKACNIETCIVTFDQPLYWKARDIIAAADNCSDLAKVVERLSGFNLLMSYLGAISHIMARSCRGPVGLLPSCPSRLASDLKFSNQIDSFRKNMEELERRGTTAKLWIQLFRMTTLLKRCLEAE